MAGVISTPISHRRMWSLAPVKPGLVVCLAGQRVPAGHQAGFESSILSPKWDRFSVGRLSAVKQLSTVCVGNLTILEFVYAGYFAFVQNSLRISSIVGRKRKINFPHRSSSFTHLKAPSVLVGHARTLLERAWCPTVPLQLRETKSPLELC